MTRRRLGFWYRLAVVLLRPPLVLLTRRDWHGATNLPRSGGVVVVTNHVSYFDPLAFAHYLYDNGRLPRFLAKAALFDLFFVGSVVRGAGQIPVYRESATATTAYSAAVDAIRRGECVVIYPEGTVTRDPGLWPMVGKTGAARVALATGAPVVPVAQWGPQDVLAPYAKRLRLLPRKTMHLRAGPPVDLSDFMGREVTAELLAAVSERIMMALTAQLEQIRGEQAPGVRFDPRKQGLPTTGNPNSPHRDPGGTRRSA
ncbi:MAG: lysophospholipid acyltransferase family protein [Actinomycetes bacterium]